MKRIIFLFLFFVLLKNSSLAQCQFSLDNFSHVNCFSENTGSIDISFTDPNISFWWTGPNGFTSNSTNISSLYSGDYILTIVSNIIPGDTSSQELCSNLDVYGHPLDTIRIQETFDIDANFNLTGQCNVQDSADVITNIFGGTPPYFTLWSNGDTSRNINNLQPNPLLPYSISITDANGCVKNQYLTVAPIASMKIFMSFVGVICKDDDSGEVSAYVSDGNPPFSFLWSNDLSTSVVDSFSSKVEGLSPDTYYLEVIDANGCIQNDTVKIKADYDVCLSPFKVFSPNNDGINDIWEIKNIEIYPNAIVEIYSKSGQQVYRRRNYKNTISDAFQAIDKYGNILPSATYYYVITLAEQDEVFKGTLTIVR